MSRFRWRRDKNFKAS